MSGTTHKTHLEACSGPGCRADTSFWFLRVFTLIETFSSHLPWPKTTSTPGGHNETDSINKWAWPKPMWSSRAWGWGVWRYPVPHKQLWHLKANIVVGIENDFFGLQAKPQHILVYISIIRMFSSTKGVTVECLSPLTLWSTTVDYTQINICGFMEHSRSEVCPHTLSHTSF